MEIKVGIKLGNRKKTSLRPIEGAQVERSVSRIQSLL